MTPEQEEIQFLKAENLRLEHHLERLLNMIENDLKLREKFLEDAKRILGREQAPVQTKDQKEIFFRGNVIANLDEHYKANGSLADCGKTVEEIARVLQRTVQWVHERWPRT